MKGPASLLVFEDDHWRDLRPLTDVLAVPSLALGGSTVIERWRRAVPLPLLALRARWTDGTAAGTPAGDVLAVNAAALPEAWLDSAREAAAGTRFMAAGRVVAAVISETVARTLLATPGSFTDALAAATPVAVDVAARVLAFPWHILEWNAGLLAADLAALLSAEGAGLHGEVDARAAVLEPGSVHVERGARVDALAVIDARGGPVVIEADAVVLPHTLIEGPCRVGRGTQLLGGFVRRTSFGPQCRIAGEVEESVWQGYANKRHHGFVGHSVIGEWVNLGALTTTSDLKNNYGPVRVWIDGREIDSGVFKVGALIGSHVKTGIGTLLPTGATIGVGANLFGGGRFVPKSVPAFAWWDGDKTIEHRLDAFLATARIACSRRARTLDAALESRLSRLFADTAGERLR